MKKVIILDSYDFYFKKNLDLFEYVEDFLKSVNSKNQLIINITRVNQDYLRGLLKLKDLPNRFIYNVHDDVKPGDFEYVINMICEFIGVKKEDVVYVGKNLEDINRIEKMGIAYINYKNNDSLVK